MRKKQILLHDYFAQWIEVYKEGAVRERTLDKYWLSHRHLQEIVPDLKLVDTTRLEYQQILNTFAQTHEKATVMDFHHQLKAMLLDAYVVQELPDNEPIFAQKRVFNSTVNNLLKSHCEELNIPVISVHGLRHTHASLLLFAGVSIASVAKRLGHADMTTTQQTYLHIIQELENKDNTKIMQHLAAL